MQHQSLGTLTILRAAWMRSCRQEREKDGKNLIMRFHQVMVCGERVGWREEARRVIIYTTDQVSEIYVATLLFAPMVYL